MKNIIWYAITWIVLALFSFKYENWMYLIFLTLGMGIFFILCSLYDIKRAIEEKGAVKDE